MLVALGAGVFLLAALAQAVTGFGSALVAVPLLALVADPVAAVVAGTTVSLVLTSGAAWRERGHIDTGRADADPDGADPWHAGGAGPAPGCRRGATRGLIATVMLVDGRRCGERRHGSAARATPIAGVASGVLLTSTGMNGPPLVVALIEREPRASARPCRPCSPSRTWWRWRRSSCWDFSDRDACADPRRRGQSSLCRCGWRLGDAVFHRIPAARLRPLVTGGLVVIAVSVLSRALT